ncbi:MAG TPA: hypothetical protein VMK12_15570, partial [Anaeromyxobacteraceae bacterium]|nr:hypothetical protein [Anaeromyxobacteraceae bacterium]
SPPGALARAHYGGEPRNFGRVLRGGGLLGRGQAFPELSGLECLCSAAARASARRPPQRPGAAGRGC